MFFFLEYRNVWGEVKTVTTPFLYNPFILPHHYSKKNLVAWQSKMQKFISCQEITRSVQKYTHKLLSVLFFRIIHSHPLINTWPLEGFTPLLTRSFFAIQFCETRKSRRRRVSGMDCRSLLSAQRTRKIFWIYVRLNPDQTGDETGLSSFAYTFYRGVRAFASGN